MIVWDLGGVVARFAPAARLLALAASTGLPAEHIHDALWGSGLDAAGERGEMEAEVVWTTTVDSLGGTISRDELCRCWSLAFVPDPTVLAIVDAIGRPNALFTDNGPILEACLQTELAPVADHVDVVLLSCRLGVTKAEPLAFRLAADFLGVALSDLLLVDDKPPNVAAARAAGWSAIQYTSPADLDQLR